MKLNIGQTITGQRKAKGLTQEQLAEKVGVSAPAVSKWETGASYPDIQLLPPLARALGCSIDKLMQFQPQLTTGQVGDLEKKVESLFKQGGYTAGEEAVDMLLHEYPNEAYLKLRMGWQLQKWIPFEESMGDERVNEIYAKVIRLFEQATEENTPYANAAKIALANLYLANDRVDQAEEIIKQLPEDDINRQTTYASIYFYKGEMDKAELEQQKLLYSSINSAKNALVWLGNIAKNREDTQGQEHLIDAQIMLAEYFGIIDVMSRVTKLELLIKHKRMDEAGEMLLHIVDNLVDMKFDYSENMFFDKLEMKFNNTPGEMCVMALKLLEQIEGIDNHAFDGQMERLRKHISGMI